MHTRRHREPRSWTSEACTGMQPWRTPANSVGPFDATAAASPSCQIRRGIEKGTMINLNKKNRFAGYLEAPVIEAVDDNARYRGSTAPAVEMPWLAYIGRVFTRLDAGATAPNPPLSSR